MRETGAVHTNVCGQVGNMAAGILQLHAFQTNGLSFWEWVVGTKINLELILFVWNALTIDEFQSSSKFLC